MKSQRFGHAGHVEEERDGAIVCSCGVTFTLPPAPGSASPSVEGVFVMDSSTSVEKSAVPVGVVPGGSDLTWKEGD